MSHIRESLIGASRADGEDSADVNKSCHTYEWVMSHIWMSHVSFTSSRQLEVVTSTVLLCVCMFLCACVCVCVRVRVRVLCVRVL